MKSAIALLIIFSGGMIIGCGKSGSSNPPPAANDNTPKVTICNQVWMLKNLDVEKYRNGDPIPQVTDNTQWANLTTGAWCYLQNDAGNGSKFGKLYNWYAVNDARGLAPTGWHIAGKNEWEALQNCLGGSVSAGDKLRETGTTNWNPNAGATNSSGFTALPGGSRSDFTGYFSLNNHGYWWSSTQASATDAYFFDLSGYTSNSYVDQLDKRFGFSVRCIKD